MRSAFAHCDTVVAPRRSPIVRTLITFMAGTAKMDRRAFGIYSAIGGLLWAVGVTVLGHQLGEVDFVREHVEIILLGVVALSFCRSWCTSPASAAPTALRVQPALRIENEAAAGRGREQPALGVDHLRLGQRGPAAGVDDGADRADLPAVGGHAA